MKEIYEKVWIKNEDDLPKEYGKYYTHAIGMGIRTIYFDEENKDRWINLYDWYLQPIEPVEQKSADEMIIEMLNKYSTTSLSALKDMKVQWVIDPMDFHKLASELASQFKQRDKHVHSKRDVDIDYTRIDGK